MLVQYLQHINADFTQFLLNLLTQYQHVSDSQSSASITMSYYYHSLIALILPVIFTHFVVFRTQLFLLETFKALNALLCADVPLRNYSLTHYYYWFASAQL